MSLEKDLDEAKALNNHLLEVLADINFTGRYCETPDLNAANKIIAEMAVKAADAIEYAKSKKTIPVEDLQYL